MNTEKNRSIRMLATDLFWPSVYGVVVLFCVARFFGLNSEGAGGWLSWNHFADAMRLPLGILVAVVFVHIFSDQIPLPPSEEMRENEKLEILEKHRQHMSVQRRTWMIFAYSFMLVSLLVPVYIFSTGWDKVQGHGEINLDHPMSVFVGCSLDDLLDGKNELSCFPVEPRSGMQGQPEAAKEPRVPAKSAWVLNLGGHVTNASDCGKENSNIVCQVRGGLLVPLYVIILALMGGSISLTRRLPEYQKRANPEYLSTEEEPKLSQHEFREYLVFQIAQFVSAPLIAVLAYYLVEPSTRQASVALAFTAGFTSESILLMVRAVTEKVSPTNAQPKSGTITGVITIDDAPAQNAEISLTASSHVRAVADDNGVYVLGNVPIGEHGITVSPASTTDNVEAITGSVKVDRAQEVVKRHWKLAEKK